MSNDVNSCTFIGRLGADPETRYTGSGDAVCSFRIAVGSQWKDKAGNKQESTEWVSITAFGKLGEICAQYLKKGSQVYIAGRMKTDEYEKDGIKRYSTKIIADRMQMLGGKSDGGQPAARSESTPAQNRAPSANSGGGQGGFNDFEDDIPFATCHAEADPIMRRANKHRRPA